MLKVRDVKLITLLSAFNPCNFMRILLRNRIPFVENSRSIPKLSNQRWYSSTSKISLNKDSIDSFQGVKLNKSESWVQDFQKKQNSIPHHHIFKHLSLNSPQLLQSLEKTSNLQHVLSSFLIDGNKPLGINGEGVEQPNFKSNIVYRSIEDLNTEESAFVLVLHCIIKLLNPAYQNNTISKCLTSIKYQKDLKSEPISLNQESLNNSVFGDKIKDIIRDSDVQLSIAFLRKYFTQRWSKERDCTFDNIFAWLNSFFEPSTSKALKQLIETKIIPNTVLYDFLLRNPDNELEYKYALEIYKSNAAKMNIIDQEKLHQIKQFEGHYNRDLVIPLVFNNLFKYALRHQFEDLPRLMDLFLKSNTIADESTIKQLGEMAWYLSIDHSGEHIGKPSRYQNITQTMIIKSINKMVKANKSLEVDVTTILAVSNLSYYKNPQKSYQLFKSAKKQFDHWKIQVFKPDNFERISLGKSHDENLSNAMLNEMIDDYNIKFLCNSIILLFVNEENHLNIAKDLRDIFEKVESHVLRRYPEIWQFILVKLHYHQMISGSIYGFIMDGYCSHIKVYERAHPFVLDVLIREANSFSSIQPILTNVDNKFFDNNNLAHFISKLYKFGPGPLEDDFQYANTIQIARDLYEGSPFKSSRVNSSYLLGESMVTPNETYNRYVAMNQNFKVSPLTISALFISIHKMVVNDQYKNSLWGDKEPIDFALQEFDKYISRVYGDELIFPNDHLLAIYIDVLVQFQYKERLVDLISRLVDLKYPITERLFDRYLNAFGAWDKQELINCLNSYNVGFKTLANCKNEYDLKERKKKLPRVKARGQFKKFVDHLEINWDVIGKWKWSGKS